MLSRSQASSEKRGPLEKFTQEDLVLNASNDVTAALRRTHHLMQAELSRSQFAQETLGKWSSTISLTVYMDFLTLYDQNNQRPQSPLYPSPTAASTHSSPTLAASLILFSALKSQILGISKRHSIFSLELSHGSSFAAFSTVPCGG